MKLFLHNGYQDIHRQGDPDLGEYRVFGGAVERFDPQVLFEPTEEEFHLPTAAIGSRSSAENLMFEKDEVIGDVKTFLGWAWD